MARLIDADALMVWLVNMLNEFDDGNDPHEIKREMFQVVLAKTRKMPTVGGWISVKEAANIIAELFGDDCACNFNGIDEWLPQYCEHAATDCPHTAGTTCWEQYIKYLNKKPDIGRKEGERNGKL